MLCDVGPRDGLQNEPEPLAPGVARRARQPARRARGCRAIEAVSFVRADRVPQMAGAEEVVAAIERRDGVEYSRARAERARLRAVRARRRSTASTARSPRRRRFNRAQRQRVPRRGGRAVEAILAAGRRAGDGDDLGPRSAVRSRAGRSGPRRRARARASRSRRARARGHDRRRDAAARAALVERDAAAEGFHGHNTRNTGYANCLAALEAGARVLDASVGGLGGCPFAPRATGNVATEDLVYLLEGEGVDDGRRPRRADRGLGVARRAARAAARGLRLPRGSLAPEPSACTASHSRHEVPGTDGTRVWHLRARLVSLVVAELGGGERWRIRSPSTESGGATVVPRRAAAGCRAPASARARPPRRRRAAARRDARVGERRLPLGARARAQALREHAVSASRFRTRSGFVRNRSSSGRSSTPRSRS